VRAKISAQSRGGVWYLSVCIYPVSTSITRGEDSGADTQLGTFGGSCRDYPDRAAGGEARTGLLLPVR